MNLYPGLVATTHSGKEFAIESTRGSKNVKGFMVKDGRVTDNLYNVPRSLIASTREKTPSERVTMVKPLESIDLGTVVVFKSPVKGYAPDTKFVVFKLAADGLTFSAVKLGGDPSKRFVRGVSEKAVTVVEV